MSISSQYKFSRVNLHKNNTQSPQFKLLKNETEITVNSDNQYDSVIVELQSNPEVVDSIRRIVTKDKPVYVDDNDRLIYDSNMMETGTLYKVKWENNIVGLRKTNDGKIDFYEFEPETE